MEDRQLGVVRLGGEDFAALVGVAKVILAVEFDVADAGCSTVE
jgi:hypothetical protein